MEMIIFVMIKSVALSWGRTVSLLEQTLSESTEPEHLTLSVLRHRHSGDDNM